MKIVTGDNERVTQHVCRMLGLDVHGVVTGAEVAKLDDTADNFKEILLLDHGIFLRCKPGTAANTLMVEAFLYDLRTREMLRKLN